MIEGTYFALLPTPGGERAHTFTLHAADGVLTGTMTNTLGAEPIFDGTYDGDHFSFHVNGGPMVMTFEGTADADGIDMTWRVDKDEFRVHADRS